MCLLKSGEKSGKNVGDEVSGQSPLFSKARSTGIESAASRSFYPLPTSTETFGSDPSAGDLTQQP